MPVSVTGLKKSADFLLISRKGGYRAMPGFVLQFMKNPALAENNIRVGFTVSRKVGIAVERNRAKRRLRQVVAAIMPENAKAQFDYVVIARTAAINLPFDNLLKDMAQALKYVK